MGLHKPGTVITLSVGSVDASLPVVSIDHSRRRLHRPTLRSISKCRVHDRNLPGGSPHLWVDNNGVSVARVVDSRSGRPSRYRYLFGYFRGRSHSTTLVFVSGNVGFNKPADRPGQS